jgi:integrase
VLKLELPWLSEVVRAKKPSRLPVVLSTQEVQQILAQLQGEIWLMASLLYGSGMRLMEVVRLRVKDVDFGRKEILIRDGKGMKDRVTVLPQRLLVPLKREGYAQYRGQRRAWRCVSARRASAQISQCALGLALGNMFSGEFAVG